MDFNSIWKLLLDNGASPRKEEGTRRFWDTLTPAQQSAAFTTISTKMAVNSFVHYDPIRAIKENMWSAKEITPQFLRGDEAGDIVQDFYNGTYKLCTRATMELFGLQWVRDW